MDKILTKLEQKLITLDSCIEIVKTPLLKKELQKYRQQLVSDKVKK